MTTSSGSQSADMITNSTQLLVIDFNTQLTPFLTCLRGRSCCSISNIFLVSLGSATGQGFSFFSTISVFCCFYCPPASKIFMNSSYYYCLLISFKSTFINLIASNQQQAPMKRKGFSRRKREDSDSYSSASSSSEPTERPQDLFKQLKNALVDKTGSFYRILCKLQRHYKQSVGILRISIPDSFSFNQNDMEQFFKKFGKMQKIVLKQNLNKVVSEDQPKNKENQVLAYVIYTQYCSAILSMKVLNSIPQKQRIFSAKICHSYSISSQSKLYSQPLIGYQKADDMITQVEKDYDFGDLIKTFKFIGTIGLDITDREYRLKQRILGVKGCNFIRIRYLCEKSFKFQHQHEESKIEDIVLKIVTNKTTGLSRDVLVMSNYIQKYNQAIRCLHELLQQIVEEYKNSKQKMIQIIPRDIHIKKWEKFQVDAQLKFLT